MKKSLAFLFCLLFVIPTQAEVIIKGKHHVSNTPRGICVWASVDTLARYHQISPLMGISYHYDSWRNEQGQPWVEGYTTKDVERQLEYAKVKGWCIEKADESWVHWAIYKDLGCVVGLVDYPKEGSVHAVVLTDINKDGVKFIDSNHVGWVFSVSLEWFRSHWTGFFIVLEKL